MKLKRGRHSKCSRYLKNWSASYIVDCIAFSIIWLNSRHMRLNVSRTFIGYVKDTHCPLLFSLCKRMVPLSFESPYSILSMCHAGPPALKSTSVICRCEGNGTFWILYKETSLPFCFSVWTDWRVKGSCCFLSSRQKEVRVSPLNWATMLHPKRRTHPHFSLSKKCSFTWIFLDSLKSANFFQVSNQIVASIFCLRFDWDCFQTCKTTLLICFDLYSICSQDTWDEK